MKFDGCVLCLWLCFVSCGGIFYEKVFLIHGRIIKNMQIKSFNSFVKENAFVLCFLCFFMCVCVCVCVCYFFGCVFCFVFVLSNHQQISPNRKEKKRKQKNIKSHPSPYFMKQLKEYEIELGITPANLLQNDLELLDAYVKEQRAMEEEAKETETQNSLHSVIKSPRDHHKRLSSKFDGPIVRFCVCVCVGVFCCLFFVCFFLVFVFKILFFSVSVFCCVLFFFLTKTIISDRS